MNILDLSIEELEIIKRKGIIPADIELDFTGLDEEYQRMLFKNRNSIPHLIETIIEIKVGLKAKYTQPKNSGTAIIPVEIREKMLKIKEAEIEMKKLKYNSFTKLNKEIETIKEMLKEIIKMLEKNND